MPYGLNVMGLQDPLAGYMNLASGLPPEASTDVSTQGTSGMLQRLMEPATSPMDKLGGGGVNSQSGQASLPGSSETAGHATGMLGLLDKAAGVLGMPFRLIPESQKWIRTAIGKPTVEDTLQQVYAPVMQAQAMLDPETAQLVAKSNPLVSSYLMGGDSRSMGQSANAHPLPNLTPSISKEVLYLLTGQGNDAARAAQQAQSAIQSYNLIAKAKAQAAELTQHRLAAQKLGLEMGPLQADAPYLESNALSKAKKAAGEAESALLGPSNIQSQISTREGNLGVARGQLGVAQGNLGLSREKFAHQTNFTEPNRILAQNKPRYLQLRKAGATHEQAMKWLDMDPGMYPEISMLDPSAEKPMTPQQEGVRASRAESAAGGANKRYSDIARDKTLSTADKIAQLKELGVEARPGEASGSLLSRLSDWAYGKPKTGPVIFKPVKPESTEAGKFLSDYRAKHAKPAGPSPSKEASPDDIKAAYQAGTLSREEAKQQLEALGIK